VNRFPVPVLGIVAYSGTGKTSLLERLIPIMTGKGLRIAAVKHSHHDFEVDKKGKDSDRLRIAGAGQVLLSSQYRTALIIEEDGVSEPDLIQQLKRLDYARLDLVLVEGFRHVDIPKLEVYRPSLGKPLLCLRDKSIIALVCDDKPATAITIPTLPLNNAELVCDYIFSKLASLS
jgi:molybdopterin-guanine dinucleotide biosynthesis protein B